MPALNIVLFVPIIVLFVPKGGINQLFMNFPGFDSKFLGKYPAEM
jgi:hypothetical protein